MSNEQTVTAPVTQVAKPEPTSAKLVELKNAAAEISAKFATTAPGSAEFNTLVDSVVTNRKEQAAELVNIAKLEADNKAALARAERTGIIDTAIKTAIAASATKATDEQKQAAQVAYDAAINLVLPQAAAKVAGTTGTGTRGAVSAEIRKLFLELVNGGKTPAEAGTILQAAPYNYARGTVGTVKTEMKNEGLITY